MEAHYCNGELTDVSFVGKPHCEGQCSSHEMVHEEEADHHDHGSKKCATKSDCEKECEKKSEGNCCKTEKLSDLSNLEYSVQLTYVQPIVLLSVLMDYTIFEEKSVDSDDTAWHDYAEPVPREDKQVLHQSFLI